ncbi:MAG: hypothetical protein ABSH45_21450 [Bryobacteraceae bacterium]|jgi:hypothetical protein
MKTKQLTAAPLRDARGHWIKGTSGNSLGRPRSALAELCRDQITKHGLVAVLGAIAARTGEYASKTKIPITVSDQINAIRLLLLYGFGQPKAEIDSGDIKIEVSYAVDNRSVTFANATRGAGEDHQGVQEVQRRLLRPEIRQDLLGSGQIDPPCAQG